MKIQKGKTYSCKGVGISWKVLSIAHETEEYTKAKLMIFNNGHHFETKWFKLINKMIQHWEQK